MFSQELAPSMVRHIAGRSQIGGEIKVPSTGEIKMSSAENEYSSAFRTGAMPIAVQSFRNLLSPSLPGVGIAEFNGSEEFPRAMPEADLVLDQWTAGRFRPSARACWAQVNLESLLPRIRNEGIMETYSNFINRRTRFVRGLP
jgi:hypothetical protein